MRALVVKFLYEVIEGGLLLEDIHAWRARGFFLQCQVHTWRARGFFLQCQVHTLVASVLLGVAGLDALDIDTQAQPPDG